MSPELKGRQLLKIISGYVVADYAKMTTGSVIEDLEELQVQQSSSICYNTAAIKKNY